MWYEIFGRVCVHRLAILCVLQKQIFGTQTKYVFMRGISFYDSESHWQMVMFFPECVMKILLFAQHDCVKQIVQHLFLWYQIQNLNRNLIYVLHCIPYSIVFMMVLLIISIFVSELQRRSFKQMWSLSIVQMHKNRKKLYTFHYSNTFTFFGV